MYINPDSPTWSFALAKTYEGLERLTLTFDFEHERRGRNYGSIPEPRALAEVIDGLLGVREHLLDGDVKELIRLKAILEGTLAAVVERGKLAAQEYWAQASPDERAQFANLMPESVIAKAWEHVPKDMDTNQANWFVEGFCRQWWSVEYLNYVYDASG